MPLDISTRIRIEMIEALRGGPSQLLTYPAADIWAAIDAGAVVITGRLGGRNTYALAPVPPVETYEYEVPARALVPDSCAGGFIHLRDVDCPRCAALLATLGHLGLLPVDVDPADQR